MGMIIDIQYSNIQFSNPRRGTVLLPLRNIVHSVMHNFTVYFVFRFDPRRGVPPPSSRQLWRIGIVQNVIFEKISFEYQGGAVFNVIFNNSVLDSSASPSNRPFYHDPVRTPPQPITNPNTGRTIRRSINVMIPFLDVWYGSQGFGELLDPFHPSGISLSNNGSVDILDEPGFGAKLRYGRSVLTRAEHIMTFQSWLVAKSPNRTHILAHVHPFSLVFWVTTQPAPNLLGIGVPAHRYGFYGQQGIVRRISQTPGTAPANIGVGNGAGGRTPVLQGTTATERGLHWLGANRLLP